MVQYLAQNGFVKIAAGGVWLSIIVSIAILWEASPTLTRWVMRLPF